MLKETKNFSFTGHFKIFAVISAVLVIVGLVGLLLLPFGVQLFNMDIDFLGGTTMQYEMHTQVTAQVTADVADIVKQVSGLEASSVTKAGDAGTQVVIKMLEVDSETRNAIFDAVAETYDLAVTDQIKSDYVSASVGAAVPIVMPR